VSVVVPYVPYQARMNATPQSFAAFLWDLRASAVLVETVSLVKREFPPDFAPVYYHSHALAIVQSAALIAALLAFARLVFLTTERDDVTVSPSLEGLGNNSCDRRTGF